MIDNSSRQNQKKIRKRWKAHDSKKPLIRNENEGKDEDDEFYHRV